MAEFKESEHPRDKDGKFTDKSHSAKTIKIGEALKKEINCKKYGYTKKEYNDHGWARANEILSAGQNKDFTTKFAQALNGYKSFPRTSSGEFMLPVSEIGGKNEGINNKIVYAKGTISKPIITRIVKINVDNETDADSERRFLYDCEWRGIQPTNSTIFGCYYATDYGF